MPYCNQWQAEKNRAKILIVSHCEAMKESCHEVLAMLLTRAQELAFSPVGGADRARRIGDVVLMQQSELREYAHTRHTLRPLTCREYLSYVQAQCEEHGCENAPLSPARVRKMHALTKGNISKTEMNCRICRCWLPGPNVQPRSARVIYGWAAGEILPAKKHGKRLANRGAFLPQCCSPPAAGI